MGRVSAVWDTFIETAPFCQEALIVCRSHRRDDGRTRVPHAPDQPHAHRAAGE